MYTILQINFIHCITLFFKICQLTKKELHAIVLLGCKTKTEIKFLVRSTSNYREAKK